MLKNTLLGSPTRTRTATVASLVSLSEAKAHCRIDFTDDDIALNSIYLPSAVETIEDACAITIIPSTLVATYNIEDTCNFFELPYGGASMTITSVTDKDNVALDAGNYEVKGSSFIQLKSYQTGVIKITYTASHSPLPNKLKLAILDEVLYQYENRGKLDATVISKGKSLAKSYKRNLI
jgi:hypothetical protein